MYCLAARDLIDNQKVQAIIGPQTWAETSLVAEVCSQKSIPLLSLADTTPEWAMKKWQFLLQSSPSQIMQMKAIAEIVKFWQLYDFSMIYEDGESSSTEVLSQLSGALTEVGSKLKHVLAIPPLVSSSLSQQLAMLRKGHCTVFIVHLSFPLTLHLFETVKRMNMMGEGNVWITTGTFTSLVHSLDPSSISNIQGIIGVKSYMPNLWYQHGNFYHRFRRKFCSESFEEFNCEPGIFAAQAYDAAWIVVQAMRETNQQQGQLLLDKILQSNFTGLSGKILFTDHKLPPAHIYQIINVIGMSYKEIGFWSDGHGFSKSLDSNASYNSSVGELGKVVNPTCVLRLRIAVPAASSYKQYVTVIEDPSKNVTSFKGFSIYLFHETVKKLPYHLEYDYFPFNGTYNDLVKQVYWKMITKSCCDCVGFSILVFCLASFLAHPLLRLFFLSFFSVFLLHSTRLFWVLCVSAGIGHETDTLSATRSRSSNRHGGNASAVDGKYDAVVGDVSIVSTRYEYASFSQPYTDTGLVMIVPVKSKTSNRAWLFVKPFTKCMWILILVIIFYNGFVVWMIERNHRPELKGSIVHQTSNILWLAFCSMFSLNGGRLHSNLSRVAMVVWLFVALIITQTYTASLASMLTVERLEPTVDSIEQLKKANATVGYDTGSYCERYLQDALGMKATNIKPFDSQESYADALRNKEIAAVFVDVPGAKLFLAKHCEGFVIAGPTYKIGGYGFVLLQHFLHFFPIISLSNCMARVFPRESPLLPSVNQALLNISENGNLRDLENFMLAAEECEDKIDADGETTSISPGSFLVLFILTGGTSTIALLIYIFSVNYLCSGQRTMWSLMMAVIKRWRSQKRLFSRKVHNVAESSLNSSNMFNLPTLG
ncbi:hypothetical protein Fmac_020195 [Flemingia macrophylla]|uniref:Glutamate receptor n=1 Tax=Flemingia macrophylla TaxID=520843 RepID=A0ABD1LTF0_9FABA